ncbi:unnamed protein product [Parnassius apollo]|uniref:(apollo) hypothetical protein n=1 Tax=Parnassius apollo TaxID=110799 RepID=A0A8S3XY18_PARAO|nr:unnamed protein product [Parnassius apollo]
MDSSKKSGPSSSEPVATSAADANTPAVPSSDENVSKPEISKPIVLSKGVENAKKRLRAFSIQKKTPIAPVVVPKSCGTGSTTVLIGKLSNVKSTTPKVDDEQKKLPKPPKPGSNKKSYQDSYSDLQKRTLAEIEDMKRKMELVELGIPLGLICPTSTSEKAMPTKAMPPIKHFLDPAKVDEIIREAKKARDEGKKYKFDYQKLLPKYDNPFQRKKEEDKSKTPDTRSRSDFDRDKKKSNRRDSRRYSDSRHNDRDKYKNRDKEKGRDKNKEKNHDREDKQATDKETNVNLNDYLVCDSWSLDNEDKNRSSPNSEDKSTKITQTIKDTKSEKAIVGQARDNVPNNKDIIKEYTMGLVKMEKLKPVMDSFKFEIDPNDEEILDIFDADSGIEKYGRKTRRHSTYSPTDMKLIDYEQDDSKDVSLDDTNDDTFLESVINEIKQEDINEDISQDKGLVEYDMSPTKDEMDVGMGSSLEPKRRVSVTPELDDRMRDIQSQRSDYSEGYRSSESGYKTSDTNESGYKSVDSYRLSMEKELDENVESKMSKSTVDSLETWSFVLKICQPLLFRHDKNKCYRETRTTPKLWYAENPKLCNCVKDRCVVYNELQMCKMSLVDRVYGCDQIPDAPFPKTRNWYPRPHLCLTESHTVPVSSEWEAEDIGQTVDTCMSAKEDPRRRRSNTPLRSEEVLLDREYQRFMKAVWPEVAETKTENSRSTTPVRQDGRKKKKEEVEKEPEVKKPVKKVKLSSEGWSQESDIEEEADKGKKMKIDKDKLRKRKRSSSTFSSLSGSESDEKKKKKSLKKKALKKSKSKSAKRRRIGKKLLRKLKEKEKKKKKQSKAERLDDSDESDDDDEDDSDKKSSKKSKKKKQQKLKKKSLKRKKKEVSSSSSTSSSSDSSSDEYETKAKKSKKAAAKKKKEKKRKRKSSSSESAQSEDLFDVNILNNIKTERLTDDEKTKSLMDFSPRRQQKPREIINVKELQNDFVGNNIHIKKEVEEDIPKVTVPETQKVKEINDCDVSVEVPVKEAETIDEKDKKEVNKVEVTVCQTETVEEKEKEENKVKESQEVVTPISVETSTSPQIIPPVPQMVQSVPQMVPKVSQMVPTVPQIIPTISQKAPTTVPQVVPTVPQMIPTVPQIIPTISQKSPTTVPQMVPTIPQMIPTISQKNSTTVPEMTPTVSQMFPTISQKVITTVSQTIPTVQTPSNIEVISTISQVNSAIPQMIPTVPQMVPAISHKTATVSQTIPTIIQKTSNIEIIPTVSQITTIPQTTRTNFLVTHQNSLISPTNSQITPTTISQIKPVMDESNMSQCSSQESVCSVKPYEKDDSHLRPSSQNSNYSFNDVINASQSGLYQKAIEPVVECEDKFLESYQQDYELYEHLAMAYQSDVASQQAIPSLGAGEQRIETVVRARSRGEIKCDWRAGHSPAPAPPPPAARPARPSRWGLKPGEVNIVLTGGSDYTTEPSPNHQHEQIQTKAQPKPLTRPHVPSPQPVYKIQSLANRTDVNVTSGYDEAYLDMYGASDRLQYGDCFAENTTANVVVNIAVNPTESIDTTKSEARASTLDARIDHALKTTVLGEVAKETEEAEAEKEAPEKGILITSGAPGESGRGSKRVSFADGYKPGQDSDVEEPPVKKRRKAHVSRRVGCAWPCPASHPDHVALWDALPPPPPPPGSPPPPRRRAPPTALLRAARRCPPPAAPLRGHKLDTNSPIPAFMPSEPPPSLLNYP